MPVRSSQKCPRTYSWNSSSVGGREKALAARSHSMNRAIESVSSSEFVVMEAGTCVKEKSSSGCRRMAPARSCVEVVVGCAEVLEHAIASGVRVFERHDEHAVIGGMYRVGTPFVIGDVIEHMTDHTDLDPLGWGRRYQRAIKDAGAWTAPGEHRPQTRMRFYCIHMPEVLEHETCEVTGTGAPIDSTRAFGIADEDPAQGSGAYGLALRCISGGL